MNGSTASQIAGSVEHAVHNRELATGALLPAVRTLAADLGVSPNTVAAAYRTLRQRGLVEAHGRRGTRVRSRPATAVRTGEPLPVPPGARDLSTGDPDPELLPALTPALRQLDPRPVPYAETGPLDRLLALGTDRLAADGVRTDALTVTHGALDALERCLLAHLSPGDRVAVEDPGWSNLLDLLAMLGLHPVPVAVDDDGPRAEAFAAALRAGVRAAIVTNRAHNPTGAAITRARAGALRAALQGHPDVLVLEDDHAAELAGVPLATLGGVTERWALVRSTSKPYGPDLRVALLAGDPLTIARVEGRQRLGGGWVSQLSQAVVAALFADPAVDAHVAQAAAAYTARRRALVDALAARGVAARGRTGVNVWVPVEDEATAVAALRDAGIVVAPGSRYRLASPPGLRITVGALAAADMPALADAVAAAVAPRARRHSV